MPGGSVSDTESPAEPRSRIALAAILVVPLLILASFFIGSKVAPPDSQPEPAAPSQVVAYDAGSEQEEPPVIIPRPDLRGMTINEVRDSLLDGELLMTFDMQHHAVAPEYLSLVSQDATVTLAGEIAPGATSLRTVLIRMDEPPAEWLSEMSSGWWYPTHTDDVIEHGAGDCFECHSPRYCTRCHVKYANGYESNVTTTP